MQHNWRLCSKSSGA